VLYGTYSRSAYIGAFVSVAVLIWCKTTSRHAKKLLLVGTLVIAVCMAGTIFIFRNNDHVQNVLFHTDEHSVSTASSNESRASAIGDAAQEVLEQPFGRGPGTAGPASVYNDNQARISENYFLQIAQEVGILGVGVFIAVCYFVGRALWRAREWSVLSPVLLASLVGLSFVNIVSHAWADDTLAYVWWGFAGLTIGAALMMTQKSEGETSNAKKTI